MKKALIFGHSGQDGFYLTRALTNMGYEVDGVSRSIGDPAGDIADYDFVAQKIKAFAPELIFHLAANSSTRHETIRENHKTISDGTLNILESAYNFCEDCKVFLSGSGLQFINNERPINEKHEFYADSAYAAERIYSAYLGRYFRQKGLRVYLGYLFHHESPLRKSGHMSQKIVQAVKKIAAGTLEQIEIGDINVKKEWTFAGDVVEGILSLVSQEKVFEATIGSGQAHSIEDWLRICFSYKNLDWKNHVVLKGGFKTDYRLLVSDPETIFSIGWRPKIDIDGLAEMMIEFSPECVESK